jgi:hypothetical protein
MSDEPAPSLDLNEFADAAAYDCLAQIRVMILPDELERSFVKKAFE